MDLCKCRLSPRIMDACRHQDLRSASSGVERPVIDTGVVELRAATVVRNLKSCVRGIVLGPKVLQLHQPSGGHLHLLKLSVECHVRVVFKVAACLSARTISVVGTPGGNANDTALPFRTPAAKIWFRWGQRVSKCSMSIDHDVDDFLNEVCLVVQSPKCSLDLRCKSSNGQPVARSKTDADLVAAGLGQDEDHALLIEAATTSAASNRVAASNENAVHVFDGVVGKDLRVVASFVQFQI